MLKTVVIGSGSWGTALAQVLVDNAREVVLWGKNPKEIDDINLRHQNTRFFPDVTLHESLKATCDLNVVRDADLLVLSVPTIAVEELCIKIGALVEKPVIVVNTSKGFHPQTNERMSNVIRRFMPKDKLKSVVSLIGPSHAEEVVLRMLTTICAVSLCEEDACAVQELFSNEYLRVYRGDDEVGSEIGVALKNAIAVASGVLSGVGYGDNTKAALITRGIAEISRLGTKMGARAETFYGLSGIGDLIVTCASVHSRNRKAGYLIGQGRTMEEAMEEVKMVVEGVYSARAAKSLAEKYQVEMPIIEEVNKVLFEDKPAADAVRDLMLRDKKVETPMLPWQ